MADEEVVVEAPDTEVTDESVNVTIVNAETEPEPEPEPIVVPEHTHPEPEHKHISECPECMAAIAAEVLAVQDVEEEASVADAPTETVIEEEPGEAEATPETKSSTGHMAPGWF